MSVLRLWQRWGRLGRFAADAGAAISLEFVLVAPILVLLAVGMVDFGSAYSHRTELASAAGAGMRYGLQNMDDLAAIEARVQAGLPAGSRATVTAQNVCQCDDGSSVSCNGSCSSGVLQRYIRITIQENVALVMDWPGIDEPLAISETAQVRVQ